MAKTGLFEAQFPGMEMCILRHITSGVEPPVSGESPATARQGSRLSWLGMIIAVAAALVSVIHDATITTTGWIVLIAGAAGGGAAGLIMARRVKMTDVPQVVSIFNAVGGGAAALVAAGGFVRLAGGAGLSTRVMIATVLDIIIGPSPSPDR